MNFDTKMHYTFDDVLLVPQYSTIKSRKDVDIGTWLFPDLCLKIPVISANMDTITDGTFAQMMWEEGGLGVLHRFASEEIILGWIRQCQENKCPAIPSVGLNDKDVELAHKYKNMGVRYICLDVAHGDSLYVKKMCQKLLKMEFQIIAGNVATSTGALRLADCGVSAVKVGIGPGSVCTTRLVTGHGVPQLSAIMDVKRAIYEGGFDSYVKIIADGGLRTPGDIVKALAAGADVVMSGKMFSKAQGRAGQRMGVYRGMASRAAQEECRGSVHNGAAEGVEVVVCDTPPVSLHDIMTEIAGGIRSGCSYSGAVNLQELRNNAQFILVSNATCRENGAHYG